ncbi:hypothetical protein [Actinoplanes sp. NPDC051859]|uniref:hypothetical protein n=1 Tax=Actinoplanes sp. NPDC051859 TaxID=3363909 RepID=UPI0037A80A8B
MTMPAVRGTSVRRTVTVAVGLLTGQALLCAVLGFLTYEEDAPRTQQRAAGPLVDAPIPAPKVTQPAPGESARSAHGRAGTQLSRNGLPAPPAPSTSSAPSGPVRIVPSPKWTALPTTTPAADPSTEPPAPPMPPPLPSRPPEDGRRPTPRIGQPCEEEDATGRTRGGRAVRCLRERGGELRWQPIDPTSVLID